MVEHLPSMCKNVRSHPSATTIKKANVNTEVAQAPSCTQHLHCSFVSCLFTQTSSLFAFRIFWSILNHISHFIHKYFHKHLCVSVTVVVFEDTVCVLYILMAYSLMSGGSECAFELPCWAQACFLPWKVYLCAQGHVHCMHAGDHRVQWVLDLLELELYTVLSCWSECWELNPDPVEAQ